MVMLLMSSHRVQLILWFSNSHTESQQLHETIFTRLLWHLVTGNQLECSTEWGRDNNNGLWKLHCKYYWVDGSSMSRIQKHLLKVTCPLLLYMLFISTTGLKCVYFISQGPRISHNDWREKWFNPLFLCSLFNLTSIVCLGCIIYKQQSQLTYTL